MGFYLLLSHPLEPKLQGNKKLAYESPKRMDDLVSQLTAQGLAQSSIHDMKIGYNHIILMLKPFGANSKLITMYKAMIRSYLSPQR